MYVRLKNVASGCDQCVWPVGVVTGCGYLVELARVIFHPLNY